MLNAFKKEERVANLHRFKDLDALRGIAALMVVFFHFAILRPYPITSFFWGKTGVDMFFIISGFVIFMSINKIAGIKQFAISRFSRLFPAYWFCVTIISIIQLAVLKLKFVNSINLNISWLKYITNLTMFQTYFGYDNIDGPYWTLLIEMLFYIGIALLMKFNKLKDIFIIGNIVLAIVLINVYLGEIFSVWPYKEIVFLFPLFNFISLFFAGIIFYKILTEPANNVKFYLAILLCYLVQIKIYSKILTPLSGINLNQYIVVLSIIFGLFILFVNNKLHFITNKVTLFLGKISYSLYLIHQFIGTNIILPGLERILHLPIFVSFPLALVIVIFIAYLINKFIEVPGGKFLKKKLQQDNLKVNTISIPVS